MIVQQTLFLVFLELTSVLTFVIEEGPSLFLSMLFPFLLFIFWYIGLERKQQKENFRLLLLDNESEIKQYHQLHNLLDDFGNSISCCKNCKSDKMQLWDYKPQKLLVVRCRSCKRNYTLSKEQDDIVQSVLVQVDSSMKLLNRMQSNSYFAKDKIMLRRAGIDLRNINNNSSPLEIMHFTATKEEGEEYHSIKDIIINEWEVVFPSKHEALAS